MQSLTQDEADAMLMKECGFSYDEMAKLNLYWKRLMMGWKEPPRVSESPVVKQDPMGILKKMKTATVQGGWKVPR